MSPKILTGVGYDKRVRVGRPRGGVDLRRVELVEVDRAGDILGMPVAR